MGVAGLWPLLEPAQSVTTLTALSFTKFGTTNRGFRIGVDASIWFFHAEYGKEGENPELRTLFFRCAQLLSQGFLPLFVFDGPMRPDIKRGKRINKSANKLVTGMQAIIEAFGFEYRTAPGEAEAELAFLNRIGVIDGILSDDVDNFLFGANVVIRNHSSTHAGAKSAIEKAKVITYTLPHPEFHLDREDLIFIALCSGGDYGSSLTNCGIKISCGLARAGFGKSLCKAAINHPKDSPQLNTFLRQWRAQLSQELRTNSSGFLPHKSPKLADSVPETFPDIKVLLAYLRPVTSETLGRSERYDDLLVNNGGQDGWLKKDPSLPMLAEKCEFYFEWGFMESIIKRFRTVIFQGVVLRIMRRAVLLRQSQAFDASTISLEHIRSHFCSTDYPPEDDDSPCPALIKDISKTRTHESTSKTLEYRVAVNPTILVQLTASGVKGIRRPDDKDEWAEFEDEFADDSHSDSEGATKAKSKKEYPDPTLPLKLWLPAIMVKEAVPGIVEAYEEVLRRKEEKKAGKGKKTKSTDQEPKAKSPRKPKAKAKANAETAVPAEEEPCLGDVPKRKAKVKAITQPVVKAGNRFSTYGVDSSDEDMEYHEQRFLPTTSRIAPRKKSYMDWVSIDDTVDADAYELSSTSKASSATARKEDIKSLFNVSKPSRNAKGKQKASIPRADSSLLSLIDEIGTPKKKKSGKLNSVRPESSASEKVAPFPLSMEDSDDPFNDNPTPPPQTPSPQKKTRKANAITSSSDSLGSEDESSPRKTREGILNKSPRKSKDHTYPKGLDDDMTRKTIRDIQHPSRPRATSPTPMRRTPLKSASAPSQIARSDSTLQPSSNANAPKGPIFISDSEDDDKPPPPRFVPNLKPPAKSAKPRPKPRTLLPGHLKASDVPNPNLRPELKTCSSRWTSSDADLNVGRHVGSDDDDIPPLLRARARSKAKLAGTGRQANAKVTSTNAVDVIELSD